jgi:hypothetical protein
MSSYTTNRQQQRGGNAAATQAGPSAAQICAGPFHVQPRAAVALSGNNIHNKSRAGEVQNINQNHSQTNGQDTNAGTNGTGTDTGGAARAPTPAVAGSDGKPSKLNPASGEWLPASIATLANYHNPVSVPFCTLLSIHVAQCLD